MGERKDKFCSDSYVADELADVIETQKRIVEAQKERGDKRLFSILIIVDDFADSAAFSRHSKLLHELYTRGRHAAISSITSVQRYRALSPIVRANATALIIFRLRSVKELEALTEENSALISRQCFREIYDEATREPYCLAFINSVAKTVERMFWKKIRPPNHTLAGPSGRAL